MLSDAIVNMYWFLREITIFCRPKTLPRPCAGPTSIARVHHIDFKSMFDVCVLCVLCMFVVCVVHVVCVVCCARCVSCFCKCLLQFGMRFETTNASRTYLLLHFGSCWHPFGSMSHVCVVGTVLEPKEHQHYLK